MRLSAEQYLDGILNANRVILARAITVIESVLPADALLASDILSAVLPHTGKARRVGITGVPGAGKSTFIGQLGMHLTRDLGETVAVLSVDPSSPVSGGSILGDKTRMEELSVQPKAFIRPSPSRGHSGGVARRTRETILLCEAAGYQNILVETVGVGQSETAVRWMTDFFLLIMLAGAGDELQGIKRGVLELIDAAVVNKADGDNERKADSTRSMFANALHLFPPDASGWAPRVMTVSSLTGKGLPQIWQVVLEQRAQLEANGYLKERRKRQSLAWMHELITEELMTMFKENATVAAQLPALEEAVQESRLTPVAAARALRAIFTERNSEN